MVSSTKQYDILINAQSMSDALVAASEIDGGEFGEVDYSGDWEIEGAEIESEEPIDGCNADDYMQM